MTYIDICAKNRPPVSKTVKQDWETYIQVQYNSIHYGRVQTFRANPGIRYTEAEEVIGPGGPRPVHFLALVGRAYYYYYYFIIIIFLTLGRYIPERV